MVSDRKSLITKKLFPIVAIYSLTWGACTKSNTTLPEDSGCVERIVIPVTAHSINSGDVLTVNNLFISNGIDNSGLRYFRYIHDTLQTLYFPYTKYDEKTVLVDQYLNAVNIFTGGLAYHFLNNNFTSRSGHLTHGTFLNATPQLTPEQIRKLFLDNIEQFDHASGKWKDSCFKAEFGYYNLNAGTSNEQEILVKAWKVTAENSIYPSEYPLAYYQDNAGKLIYYDNGIRVFK